MKSKTRILEGMRIGISISDAPKQDLFKRSLIQDHVNDALMEISRYLLAAGATLVYGGIKAGYTDKLSNAASEYNDYNTSEKTRILNIQAFPFHQSITIAEEAALLPVLELERLDLIEEFEGLTEYEKNNLFTHPESNYILGRNLTEMRVKINKDLDARIFLGGKVTEYKGCMPGILEEFLLAKEQNIPLFLLGGFGGCAADLVSLLSNTIGETRLSHEWQKENNSGFQETLDQYATKAKNLTDKPVLDLSKAGWPVLQNQLNDAENQRLSESPFHQELTTLLLKGLSNIKNK